MSEQTFTIGQISLAGIFLVLLTVWLNHLLANTRDARNKRANQSIKIIEAFQPEFDAIIQTSKDCRLIMTDEAYRKHDSAVRTYMRFLSWYDRLRLKWLWHRLAMVKIDKNTHIVFYDQYADCGSLDKRKKIRPIVEKRIHDIMSFVCK